MTSDSDDVADTADRKPEGSKPPPQPPPADRSKATGTGAEDDGADTVATGEEQARINAENDPPA